MRLSLALSFAAALLLPSPSAAEEPNGFDGFAFGTPRSALLRPLFQERCEPDGDPIGPRFQGPRVTCRNYVLQDIGPVTVTLLFGPTDRLTGYVVFIPEHRHPEFRAITTAKFGPPTSEVERGQTQTWKWPSGTTATMTTLCIGKRGCLTVKGKEASASAAPR